MQSFARAGYGGYMVDSSRGVCILYQRFVKNAESELTASIADVALKIFANKNPRDTKTPNTTGTIATSRKSNERLPRRRFSFN